MNFQAGLGAGLEQFAQLLGGGDDEDDDPADESIINSARLRLSGLRSSWPRIALRRAAMEGLEVYVELCPDGEEPGAMKISGACRVTSTSMSAKTAGPSRRWWRLGDYEDDWRDDEFELTFTTDVRCESIGLR